MAVTPATYTLTESAAAGWDLASIACTGNAGAANVNVSARTVSVPVAVNENVVCTFNNRRQGQLTLRKQTIGGDGSFSFTSSAPGLSAVTLTTSGGSAQVASSSLSAGTYTITEGAATGWTLASIACTGGTATPDLANRTVSVSVAAGASTVCTFVNTEAQARTERIVKNFMTRRGERITSNGPLADRLIDRLSDDAPQECGGSLKDDHYGSREDEQRACHPVDRTPPMKLGREPSPGSTAVASGTQPDEARGRDAGVRASGSGDDEVGRVAVSGSLSAMQKASNQRDGEKMRLGGLSTNRSGQPLFDVWLEAVWEYNDFGKALSTGHFGLVKYGVDYKLAPGLLVGVMVQHDTMDEKSEQLGYSINGTGWMAGPYAAMRLSKNLFLDGRVLHGKSSNTISPFLTYSDDFSTTRWLGAARLTGLWSHGNWQFSPSAEIVYFVDKSEDYIDSNGFMIESQEARIGRVILGPKVSYTIRGDGSVLVPYASVKGIWDFEKSEQLAIDPAVVSASSDLHLRLELGATMRWTSGLAVDVGVAYGGFADDNASSTAIKGAIKIPLN
jgi:outer membrane autotransporter protein